MNLAPWQACADAGMTAAQAAEHLGRHIGSARNASMAGVKFARQRNSNLGRGKKVDPARIRELAAEGYSQATIGVIVGVSRERIRKICNRDGIETLPGGHNYDISDQMEDCAARGLTLQQAAAELGLAPNALRRKARNEGIIFAEPARRWHEVRDAAAEGLTQAECAKRMGWTPQMVWGEAKRHGIVFQKHCAARQSAVNGVSWLDRDQRWLAHIGRDGRHVYLGSFVDEADAIAARKAAEASK